MSYQSINPFNGELVKSFEEQTDQELGKAITTAADCFETWRKLSFPERAAIVSKAAAMMRGRAEEFARPVTLEMGKLFAESLGEVALCADILDYYATHAERFLAPAQLNPDSGEAVVESSPLGVLFGVQPWNFPYYQLARFAGPNLMAGNVVMVKHSGTVLEDADLDKTLTWALWAKMNNMVQCCIAGKRFIVAEALADRFLGKFKAAMEALKPGDPMDPGTTLGPLATEGALGQLVKQVDEAVAHGATLVLGGQRVDRPGAFMQPTILTDIQPDNPAYREEFFGPVALFFRVQDEEATTPLAPFSLERRSPGGRDVQLEILFCGVCHSDV